MNNSSVEYDEVIVDFFYVLKYNYPLNEVFNIMPIKNIIEALLKNYSYSAENNIQILFDYLETYLLTIGNINERKHYFNKIEEIENLFILIHYIVDEVINHVLKDFNNEYIFKKWLDNSSIIFEKIKYE